LAILIAAFVGCDFDNQVNRESVDLKKLSFSRVMKYAEQALEENDAEYAVAAMSELRGREEVDTVMRREIGRVLLGAGAMKESAAIHDEIVEKVPNIMPRLWQRGIALYYAGEYQKGVEQFESYQTFSSNDVENSVWHLLCQSRLTSVEEAREEMIMIKNDRRPHMQQVFDLFAGSGMPERVLKACKYKEGNSFESDPIYHGLIYVGLYHEMMGDGKAANAMMLEALKYKPQAMTGLMGYVAAGHLRANNAFPTNKDDK
jgi:lipoprotein NlpI